MRGFLAITLPSEWFLPQVQRIASGGQMHAFAHSLKLSPKYATQIDEHRRFYWVQTYNNGIRYARSETPHRGCWR